MSYAQAVLYHGSDPADLIGPDEIPVAHRLARFAAFDTELQPFHRKTIGTIAQKIAVSHRGSAPIRCVRLVGHAATWRDMKTEDYFKNAMARAYSVAKELSAQLQAQGISAKTLSEDALQIGSNGRRCKPQKGVAVALYVGSRGNKRPVVPNLIKRSDKAARANRAENRRVDVSLFTAIPRKRKKRTVPIYKRGDTNAFVEKMIKQSFHASTKARSRMNKLAAMPEAARRAAWNAGPEVIWFGRYEAGGQQTPFRLVRRFTNRIYRILHGKDAPPHAGKPARRHVLTVESFDCNTPPRKICKKQAELPPPLGLHPVKRWSRAAKQKGNRAKNLLDSENRTIDARFICCNEQETLGLAFRSVGVDVDRPLRNPPEPPPHKIALCPGFFKEPRGKRRKRWWKEARRITIAHEIAHLAGVSKLVFDPVSETHKDAEIYGTRLIKRLARRKPALARVNADNYAAYVMSFA